ncbi:chemotaxis protein CheD [Ketogulonicigenium vulgare]|uniref:Probable chemoreceptor glutamine deamidase CheD n=1 Tax=Ketogulonicigenium vulgare (strain WSH-001) TaxID=759362 RepID=F9Y7G0_KETVW|nr:chemotaxis protein CheD [Ketogulonicigenium vulgare]ADO42901.1 CheD [Ketogulonicigenium vulgare Y25]AEM41088.1 chemoreceptor glutamine deamidase CheD [Ketogulonicigenium vulgare WSH-001]ALJ81230.1 chemotaxis protein CheD [Ketogulonicigenium vulgare]ANW33972.1 chemotaxis protein CheD [Ketogulonicigenium vulgare]AOZ54811.1 CheD [Ketogulonicigenium vulgare]
MTLVQNKTIHVVQGDCAISDDPMMMVTTVLGSCVSACLFDVQRGIGGMNHFLLPDAGRSSGDNRYAAAAMEVLVNSLLRRGAQRGSLQAKLFGGARMLAGLSDIGQRNAEAARQFLQAEGVPVIGADLGGDCARRIRFWPASGRAQVLHLRGDAPPLDETPSRPRAGAIELF